MALQNNSLCSIFEVVVLYKVMPEEITNNAYGARIALETAIDYVSKAIHIVNSLEPTTESAKTVKYAASASVSMQQSIAQIDKLTGEEEA